MVTEDAIRDYYAGLPVRTVVERHGLRSRGVLYGALRRSGRKTRGSRLTPATRREIEDRYYAGEPVSSICAALGVTRYAVKSNVCPDRRRNSLRPRV